MDMKTLSAFADSDRAAIIDYASGLDCADFMRFSGLLTASELDALDIGYSVDSFDIEHIIL